jgi:hypothetical protein
VGRVRPKELRWPRQCRPVKTTHAADKPTADKPTDKPADEPPPTNRPKTNRPSTRFPSCTALVARSMAASAGSTPPGRSTQRPQGQVVVPTRVPHQLHSDAARAAQAQAYPKNVVDRRSFGGSTPRRTPRTSRPLRYEIEHPVINDANSVLFRKFGSTGWPAIRIIDPEGYFIGGEGGGAVRAFDAFFKKAIPIYAARPADETRCISTCSPARPPRRCGFPAACRRKSNRLFITDSNHNRIVIATLDGQLLETIGSGEIGEADGDFQTASFDHPQGCALAGDTLYVADTENHCSGRSEAKTVSTIAGRRQASILGPV